MGAVALLLMVSAGAAVGGRYATRVPVYPWIGSALRAMEARHYPRTVHRGEAMPGRFGDTVLAAWNDALAIDRGLRENPTCFAAMALEPDEVARRLSEPACAEFLGETHAGLTRILEGTLREEGGFAPSWGLLAPVSVRDSPSPPSVPVEILGSARFARVNPKYGIQLQICKRAALEVFAEVARGNLGGAVQACGDAMAFARDIELGGNMIDAVDGRTCIEGFAIPACTRALDTATPEERREMGRALGVVRDGLPRVGPIAQDDGVVSWLYNCGPVLDDDGRAALSLLARRKASEQSPPGFFARLSLAASCRESSDEVRQLLLRSATEVERRPEIATYAEAMTDAGHQLAGLIAHALAPER
jgi:hypothetical protein